MLRSNEERFVRDCISEGPNYILFKISVTLSKKDQRKAWLGITTYEVCQHSITLWFHCISANLFCSCSWVGRSCMGTVVRRVLCQDLDQPVRFH